MLVRIRIIRVIRVRLFIIRRSTLSLKQEFHPEGFSKMSGNLKRTLGAFFDAASKINPRFDHLYLIQ